MVKIRLRRMGARNRPYYRIVVSDSRRTARAEVLEELGHYDPIAGGDAVQLNRDRTSHWIQKGASVSPTVASLLKRLGSAPAEAR
jgi:small subunit ribosomal protein S16